MLTVFSKQGSKYLWDGRQHGDLVGDALRCDDASYARYWLGPAPLLVDYSEVAQLDRKAGAEALF